MIRSTFSCVCVCVCVQFTSVRARERELHPRGFCFLLAGFPFCEFALYGAEDSKAAFENLRYCSSSSQSLNFNAVM